MKSLTYGFFMLVTVFNIAFADSGKVAFQEGQYKRASLLLQPSDPVNDFYLGKLRLYGYGLLKNTPLALHYFTEAANKGYLPAEQLMARYSLVAENDPAKALNWFKKAAANGDTTARMYCAAAYLFGYGAPKNPDIARKFYIDAARDGDPLAQFTLGNNFLESKALSSKKLGLIWLNKAVSKGNAQAENALGELLLEGKVLPQNTQQAQQLFEKAALQGLASAMVHLGELAQSQHQDELAKSWFSKAKLQDNQDKQANPQQLVIHWLTDNKAHDFSQTPYRLSGILKTWLSPKAHQDHQYFSAPEKATIASAQLFKPNFRMIQPEQIPLSDYLDSITLRSAAMSPTLQDYPQYPLPAAIAFYKNLDSPVLRHGEQAELIYPNAQLNEINNDPDILVQLGLMPATQRQRINFQGALLALYNRAILSDADAQFELGQLYNTGVGVAKNINQAITYYQLAAIQQEVRAEYNLGLLYLSGQTDPIDYAKGVDWMTDAAFKGNAPAQYVLASIYQRGLSDANGQLIVSPSPDQSMAMYYLASSSHFAPAEYQLATLLVKQNANTFSVEAKAQRQQFIKQLYADAVRQGHAESRLPLSFYLAMSPDQDEQHRAYTLAIQASSDNPTAALLLGILYDRGIGVGKDKSEALHWYEQSLNHPVTAFILGTYASNGVEGPQDKTKANDFLSEASKQHLPYATYNLAILRHQQKEPFLPTLEQAQKEGSPTAGLLLADYALTQSQTPEHLALAQQIYTEFAEKGDRVAATKLGYLYDQGLGMEPNPALAEKWYQVGATQHQPIAQFLLGSLYQSGKLNQPNYAEAEKWYRAASLQGNPQGTIALGVLEETVHENYQQAAKDYTLALPAGNPIAQYNLALIKEYGKDQPVDYAGALSLYTEAAQNNHLKSMTQLGHLYLNGLGTEKDTDKASYWFEKAASSGEPTALYQLGLLKNETDPKQAALDFEKAANLGNEQAVLALAGMLQQGKGVPKNEERAIALYTQAANQHNAQAALDLAKLYFQQGQVQQAKQWLEKAKAEGHPLAEAELSAFKAELQPRVSLLPAIALPAQAPRKEITTIRP